MRVATYKMIDAGYEAAPLDGVTWSDVEIIVNAALNAAGNDFLPGLVKDHKWLVNEVDHLNRIIANLIAEKTVPAA